MKKIFNYLAATAVGVGLTLSACTPEDDLAPAGGNANLLTTTMCDQFDQFDASEVIDSSVVQYITMACDGSPLDGNNQNGPLTQAVLAQNVVYFTLTNGGTSQDSMTVEMRDNSNLDYIVASYRMPVDGNGDIVMDNNGVMSNGNCCIDGTITAGQTTVYCEDDLKEIHETAFNARFGNNAFVACDVPTATAIGIFTECPTSCGDDDQFDATEVIPDSIVQYARFAWDQSPGDGVNQGPYGSPNLTVLALNGEHFVYTVNTDGVPTGWVNVEMRSFDDLNFVVARQAMQDQDGDGYPDLTIELIMDADGNCCVEAEVIDPKINILCAEEFQEIHQEAYEDRYGVGTFDTQNVSGASAITAIGLFDFCGDDTRGNSPIIIGELCGGLYEDGQETLLMDTIRTNTNTVDLTATFDLVAADDLSPTPNVIASVTVATDINGSVTYDAFGRSSFIQNPVIQDQAALEGIFDAEANDNGFDNDPNCPAVITFLAHN